MSFDNPPGSAEATITSENSNTHTLSAVAVPDLGANSIGIVSVALLATSDASHTITGVTWGGTAMGKEVGDGVNNLKAEIWSLQNPPDNGNKDIVVTFSGTTFRTIHIVAIWSNGAAAITRDDVSNETGATQNPDIVSTQAGANALVISVSATENNGGVNAPTGCTTLQDWDSGGNCSCVAYEIPAGSGDTTHTHNYAQAASSNYAMVSASFKEEAGAGPTMAWDDRGIMRGMNRGLQRGQGV